MDVKLNVEKLNAAFVAALPEAEERKMGFAGVSDVFDKIVGIQATICGAWPVIRKVFLAGVGFYGIFKPKEAAQARAFVIMCDQEFIPVVCATDVVQP